MIVIGDVHGCYKTLMELIKQFPKDEKICFVGDLIDRGKDSKKVLDFVFDNRYDCVMGNHEEMMLTDMNMWVCNGGFETIDSIGQNNLKEYCDRIRLNLPFYKIYPDIKNNDGRMLMVSHAGLCNSGINHCIKTGMITWYRGDDIVDCEDMFQVFGHTPVKEPIIRSHYANIDTGSVFKKLGVLTALQFPEMKIYQQKNIE
jgi:serine/threonine protein phosphatase 1